MKTRSIILCGLALNLLFAGGAHADDTHFVHPWNFKVRNTTAAMSRASLMWQAENSDRTAAATATTSGTSASDTVAALGAMPQIGSIANMNIVNVIVGDNSSADVAVEAEQQNNGNVDATAISAIGDTINIGPVN